MAVRKEGCLQRFFSTFPGRWPGVGLLLLRAVVGIGAAGQGGTYLAGAGDADAVMWAVGLLGIASGASLLIGFLTPGAAALAGLTIISLGMPWLPAAPSGPLLDRIGALSVAAVAVAVVLLGPGALSVDAQMFGRREIVFSNDASDRS